MVYRGQLVNSLPSEGVSVEVSIQNGYLKQTEGKFTVDVVV